MGCDTINTMEYPYEEGKLINDKSVIRKKITGLLQKDLKKIQNINHLSLQKNIFLTLKYHLIYYNTHF